MLALTAPPDSWISLAMSLSGGLVHGEMKIGPIPARSLQWYVDGEKTLSFLSNCKYKCELLGRNN